MRVRSVPQALVSLAHAVVTAEHAKSGKKWSRERLSSELETGAEIVKSVFSCVAVPARRAPCFVRVCAYPGLGLTAEVTLTAKSRATTSSCRRCSTTASRTCRRRASSLPVRCSLRFPTPSSTSTDPSPLASSPRHRYPTQAHACKADQGHLRGARPVRRQALHVRVQVRRRARSDPLPRGRERARLQSQQRGHDGQVPRVCHAAAKSASTASLLLDLSLAFRGTC